jgi:branched-chain amino acid transport system ATP-binding protein
MKAISRTVPPSSGHISFRGRSLDGLAAYKVVSRSICHCPEGRRLFPELSVTKNLMLGAYLRNDKNEIARDLEKVYQLFPILEERS